MCELSHFRNTHRKLHVNYRSNALEAALRLITEKQGTKEPRRTIYIYVSIMNKCVPVTNSICQDCRFSGQFNLIRGQM